jgi:hypothetical protein
MEKDLLLVFGNPSVDNDAIKIIEQAKEMEKMYYTEFEVLQLLLKLQQTESYDNLYDWFQENKKTNL